MGLGGLRIIGFICSSSARTHLSRCAGERMGDELSFLIEYRSSVKCFTAQKHAL